MKIPKNCLIERVASTDKTRLVLAHPYLDVERKTLVATNGCALVALPVEIDPGDTSGPITIDALAAARKVGRKGELATILAGTDQKLINQATCPRANDINYPDWTRVMPRNPGKIRISFNAHLLVDITKAMGCTDVILEFDDATSPIKVTPGKSKSCWSISPSCSGAVGVLMPIKLPGPAADSALE